MNKGRLDKLLEMFESDQDDSFVLYALAKEYETTGNTDKAIESYLLLKSKNQEYVGLYYHLAKIFESTGSPEKAMIIYDEGIEVAKKISDFHALSELKSAKLNLELEL